MEGVQENPTCSSTTNHWWGGNLEPQNCAPLAVPASKLAGIKWWSRELGMPFPVADTLVEQQAVAPGARVVVPEIPCTYTADSWTGRKDYKRCVSGALDDLQAATCLNLDQNAVQNRWGQQAVNQSRNYVERLNQCQLNVSNEMWSADGTRVETTNVQQVADQTFFQRGRRWIDGRAVGEELEPHRTVEFGTEAYRELMGRFIEEGRQGILSLEGEILIQLDGERILIVNAGC